jgi:hypothetical protein
VAVGVAGGVRTGETGDRRHPTHAEVASPPPSPTLPTLSTRVQVRVSIDGIGTLSNPVAQETDAGFVRMA